MITVNDIFRQENMLCIAFADASLNVKGYETSNERPPALLYQAGKLTEVRWMGMRIFDGKRCLCFDEKDLTDNQNPAPATELAYSLRANSFELIKDLTSALELIEKTSSYNGNLDWSFSSLPLSSFYFFQDKSVLILPEKACSIIDALTHDEDRFQDREAWYVHEEANNFGKANFLLQLVYYALTGIKPYGPEDVRNTGYKPVPVSLYFTDNDGKIKPQCEKLLKAIDNTFTMKRKKMYEVSNPYEYVHQILQAAIANSNPNDYVITNSSVCKDYLQKLNQKAKCNLFLRKRGTLLTVIAVICLLVIGIAWYYISLALTPPETAGCTKTEIVSSYYQALNDLDITALEDALARGCDSPDSMEVISLNVTFKTRQAYENVDSILTPEQWLEEGKPAITQGGMIYGATNVTIEETGEYEALATMDFYRPYEDEADTESSASSSTEQTSTKIGRYKKVVKFSFVQKKDWLEISDIEELENTLQEVFEVAYTENKSSLSTMLVTDSSF